MKKLITTLTATLIAVAAIAGTTVTITPGEADNDEPYTLVLGYYDTNVDFVTPVLTNQVGPVVIDPYVGGGLWVTVVKPGITAFDQVSGTHITDVQLTLSNTMAAGITFETVTPEYTNNALYQILFKEDTAWVSFEFAPAFQLTGGAPLVDYAEKGLLRAAQESRAQGGDRHGRRLSWTDQEEQKLKVDSYGPSYGGAIDAKHRITYPGGIVLPSNFNALLEGIATNADVEVDGFTFGIDGYYHQEFPLTNAAFFYVERVVGYPTGSTNWPNTETWYSSEH